MRRTDSCSQWIWEPGPAELPLLQQQQQKSPGTRQLHPFPEPARDLQMKAAGSPGSQETQT